MRLFVGLINSEVSWNQPGELTEKVSSKVNLDQQCAADRGERLG
jgi:hypothetical protein